MSRIIDSVKLSLTMDTLFSAERGYASTMVLAALEEDLTAITFRRRGEKVEVSIDRESE